MFPHPHFNSLIFLRCVFTFHNYKSLSKRINLQYTVSLITTVFFFRLVKVWTVHERPGMEKKKKRQKANDIFGLQGGREIGLKLLMRT